MTSASLIAHAALDLFIREGFENTTMDAVAAAAGVSRRTLFQYFPSKSAIVWHGAQQAYEALLTTLNEVRSDSDWHPQVADAMVASLQFPDDDLQALRLRLQLINAEPSLQTHLFTDAHQQLHAIAQRIAASLGTDPDDLAPFVLARTAWTASFSALLWWAQQGHGDPRVAARQALELLGLKGRDPTPGR
ncbi:MAG: TetR/AcrR family transcriptional regulator [Propionicimonas sp.]